jgi:hypothetical protein
MGLKSRSVGGALGQSCWRAKATTRAPLPHFVPQNPLTEVVVRQGIRSLGYLLDAPVKYRTAADLFRLDLYKQFDVDTLAQLAAPAKVSPSYAEPSK